MDMDMPARAFGGGLTHRREQARVAGAAHVLQGEAEGRGSGAAGAVHDPCLPNPRHVMAATAGQSLRRVMAAECSRPAGEPPPGVRR